MTDSPEFSEQPKTPEIAIDLTEKERSDLFKTASRLLKTRGTVIRADPNVRHYSEKGELYTPAPYREAEIPPDILETHALPYDKVILTCEEEDFGDEGPVQMVIGVQSMTTGNIPLTETESTVGIGTKTQWVFLGRDPDLGLVVYDEEGEIELRPPDDDSQITQDQEGNPVELRGAPLYVDEAPPMSRKELVELTGALAQL